MKDSNLKLNNKVLLEIKNIHNNIMSSAESDCNGVFWRISTYNRNTKTYEYKIAENIYEGNAGILVFLMDYYGVVREKSILSTIKSSAYWLINYCESNRTNNYGFYTGRGGVCYALAKASELLNLPFLLESAIGFMEGCVENQLDDKKPIDFDLLTGLSGTILSLLHLHSYSQKKILVDKIVSLLNFFIDGFTFNHKAGISWNRSYRNVNSLCGLSHGAAGISWILYEVGYYFSNKELKALAKQCYLYEQSYYSASREDWPDLRKKLYDSDSINEAIEENHGRKKPGNDYAFMSAWCHGAPGIGLTRLRMYALTKDEKFMQQAKIAMETTLRGFPINTDNISFSLCHGIGGNSYLTSLFADTVDLRLKYKSKIQSVMQNNFEKALKQRIQLGYYKSGLLRDTDLVDIGLFNGAAGIGYFMLFIHGFSDDMDILCPKIKMQPSPPYEIKISNFISRVYEALYPVTMFAIKKTDIKLYNNILSKDIDFESIKLKDLIKTNIKHFIAQSEFHKLMSDAFFYDNSRIKCSKLSTDDSFIYLQDIESQRKNYLSVDPNSKIILNGVCLLRKNSWKWGSYLLKDKTDFSIFLAEKDKYWTLFKCVSGGVKEYQLNDFSAYIISHLKKPIQINELIGYFKKYLNIEEPILMQQINQLFKANIIVID